MVKKKKSLADISDMTLFHWQKMKNSRLRVIFFLPDRSKNDIILFFRRWFNPDMTDRFDDFILDMFRHFFK